MIINLKRREEILWEENDKLIALYWWEALLLPPLLMCLINCYKKNILFLTIEHLMLATWHQHPISSLPQLAPQSHQISVQKRINKYTSKKYQIHCLSTLYILTNLFGDFVTFFFHFLGNNLYTDPAVHPASQFWFYKVCFEILI